MRVSIEGVCVGGGGGGSQGRGVETGRGGARGARMQGMCIVYGGGTQAVSEPSAAQGGSNNKTK